MPLQTSNKNYTDIALNYAHEVVESIRIENKWVVLACKRFLNYYTNPPKDYTYYAKKANKVCRFCELLKHVKGELAGQNIILQPWQIFIICNVFGFIHKIKKTRMIIEAYEEVARGAGKSTFMSALALYMLLADGEKGADVYSLATTKEQASIVFEDAKQMALGNKDLLNYYGVQCGRNGIFSVGLNAKFRALSSDANTLDGLNIHFAVIDELHAHKTPAVYNVTKTAIGKRAQPLIFCITTAGYNLDGICMTRRKYVQKLLLGEIEDISTFGIIYTVDDGDDWRSIDSAKKAQPNFGVSTNARVIQMQLKSALNSVAEELEYKTKYLNLWCQADTAFIDSHIYAQCVDHTLKAEDFKNECCLYSVDLATKYDLLAVIKLFARKIKDDIHYYVFADFFLPSETIAKSNNVNYGEWVRRGYIHEMGGKVNNFLKVEEFIVNDSAIFEPVGLVYDPYHANEFVQIMQMQGFKCIECQNTVKTMSEPMKNIKALMLNKQIHFSNNETLEWCFNNVVCHEDLKNNVYPRKEKNKRDNKIDGAVATIMAMAVAMRLNFGENFTV